MPRIIPASRARSGAARLARGGGDAARVSDNPTVRWLRRCSCATTTFADRLAADADDLQATLDAVSKRPDADPERAIGHRRFGGRGGGYRAFAARNPKNLRGVISISGGLRMPDCPKEDVLVKAYKTFGLTSRVPSLWIYARNDSFFGPALVERMQSAFLDGGGDVKLVMFEKFGTDGHALFAAASGRLQWLMEMDAFLRFHNLPMPGIAGAGSAD